jgi:hypothetical protein
LEVFRVEIEILFRVVTGEEGVDCLIFAADFLFFLNIFFASLKRQ